MFFRNLYLLRFSPAVAADLGRLGTAAGDYRLQRPGAQALYSTGFVPPADPRAEALTFVLAPHTMFRTGREDRILPSSVINDHVAEKVEAIVKAEGRKVNGRERKRLREEAVTTLLPRAFIRGSRTGAYVDRANGWIVIDTSSRKAAEELLVLVREALGSFPAIPLAPKESPRLLMTYWLASGDLPAGLALGDECDLRDPATATGARWAGRQADLESDEVKEHLHSGKQVFQLGLVFQERMSFVLGEDLVVRKFKFLDHVLDKLGGEYDDEQAELSAMFSLMSLELATLLARLEKWFGLPRPQDVVGGVA